MRARWFGVFCTLLIMALPLHGTTSAPGGGPAGGTIRALAMDPSNPSTIYAGANVPFDALAQTFEQKRSGGIFKTTDGGQSWIAVSNGLPDTPVQSLAVDPNNPNTVYAAIEDNGIFKTVDGGQNWNPVNTGLDLVIFVLAVDPRNSSTVYAGSDSGIFFKSTNGGQSWTSVNLGLTVSVSSFAFDPANPSTMYVGTQPNGATAGLFKTTDGGQSWTLTSAGLNEPPLGRAVTVSAIAIDPTNPDRLYVAGPSVNSSGSVFKSVDGGQSWTLMALNLGVSSILVHPSQPATLFAAGVLGFFKSTDAGASWIAMNAGLTDTEIQALVMNPANPSTQYAATANDGVFKTVDGGQLWASASAGITARVVGALAVDPSNAATLYAGSGASLFKTTDSGTTWIPLDAIDPGQKFRVQFGFLSFAIDPTDSNTLYAGGFIPSGVLKSTNGGQSWVAATEPFLGNVSGLAIDPTITSTIYAGSVGNGVLKSIDGGQNWSVTPLAFSQGANVSSLALDPANPAILYAGSFGGGIYKSTDGALSWTPVLNGSFYSLVAVPTLPMTTLYAGSATGSVYMSADGGATWSILLGGVSDSQGNLASVRALAVPASTPMIIYAGIFDAGVYKSTDQGQTWIAINTGLPNLRILRLVVDPASPGTIYAATSGAGVFKSWNGGQSWQGTEPAPGTGTPAISVSPSQITFPPTLVNTTSAPVTVTVNNPGTATLSISDISTQDPFKILNFSPNIVTGIAPNTSGTFDVIFSPAGAGPYSGSVSITSNVSTLPKVVSLQGTGVPIGNITVKTNIPATFTITGTTITGTVNLTGSGTSVSFTGVPIGTYTVVFNSVAKYITAATQSQTLTANNTLVFDGEYMPATLIVCPTASPSCAPTIVFSYQQGTLIQSPTQQVTVSSNASNVSFLATTDSASSTWLAATTTDNSTPATVRITVASNLKSSVYSGYLVVTSPDVTNSPQFVTVTVSVTKGPAPQIPVPGLQFPVRLDDSTSCRGQCMPNTANISAVFDHQMVAPYEGTSKLSCSTLQTSTSTYGKIMDFAGEELDGPAAGGKAKPSTTAYGKYYNLCGYSGGVSISFLSGYYLLQPTFLYYDGHPGYDYPFPFGTPSPLFPAISGCVTYALQAAGASPPAKYHVLTIVPKRQRPASCTGTVSDTGYTVAYLHLSSFITGDGTVQRCLNGDGTSCSVCPECAKEGEWVDVSRVSPIAYVGNYSVTQSVPNGWGGVRPHLHFEVDEWIRGTPIPIDPYGWQPDTPGQKDPYSVLHSGIVNQTLWIP